MTKEEANGYQVTNGTVSETSPSWANGRREGLSVNGSSSSEWKGQRVETSWSLCCRGAALREVAPQGRRDRKQEASEGSTVQLGMTLERSLWENTPLREHSVVLCV